MKKKTMVKAIKNYIKSEVPRNAALVPKPAVQTASKPARVTQVKRCARHSTPKPATAKGGGTHVEFNPMRDVPEK